MNPTDINRRIAELCGWTHIEDNKALMLGVPVWVGYPPTGAMVGKKQPTPNYYESLDACASFEIAMNELTRRIYADNLGKVVDIYDDWYAGITYAEASKLIWTTAPQRCVAFLRMKGEWVE